MIFFKSLLLQELVVPHSGPCTGWVRSRKVVHGSLPVALQANCLLIFTSLCCGEEEWEGEEEGKRINEQTHSWPRQLLFPRAVWQILSSAGSSSPVPQMG